MFISLDASVPSSVVEIDSPCEINWVHLHMQKATDVDLGSFYTLPHSPKSTWNDLSQCLSQKRHKFTNAMMLLGDNLNCPGIDCSTSLLTDSYLSRSFLETLISFAHNFLLKQVNTKPTNQQEVQISWIYVSLIIIIYCRALLPQV